MRKATFSILVFKSPARKQRYEEWQLLHNFGMSNQIRILCCYKYRPRYMWAIRLWATLCSISLLKIYKYIKRKLNFFIGKKKTRVMEVHPPIKGMLRNWVKKRGQFKAADTILAIKCLLVSFQIIILPYNTQN